MSLFGSSGGTSFSFGSTAASTSAASSKDIEVTQPPGDTISCLRFSPKADFLVSTSWDNVVSISIESNTKLCEIPLFYKFMNLFSFE